MAKEKVANITESVSGKKWQERKIDDIFIHEIKVKAQVSDIAARLLASRVESSSDIGDFLDPKIRSTLPDPFHLIDMEKGVMRMISAIKLKEKICIFADYDVDGATSSALIKNVLADLGTPSDIYVPDRIKEGYGPTEYGIEQIAKTGARLIITVDCGSLAFEALKKASELGMDVIVIDHHMSIEVMPEAVALINPNRIDESTKYTNLAAVGVSFLFVVGLVQKLKQENFFSKVKVPDLMQYLDIVALGTVCDVMKLVGLNRTFVKQGLKIAQQRKNIGYTALCDAAGIDQELSCYHLGYIIGPMINAGGRVGRAQMGAKILSTKDPIEANQIAQELLLYNNERKVIESVMLEDAMAQGMIQSDEPVIFVIGNGWHQGVIGIIAGRIKDRYNRPVVALAIDTQSGYGKASCRSVDGADFGAKILKAKTAGLIVSGGGHAMAAGFTVEMTRIDELKEFLRSEFTKDFMHSSLHLYEYYDIEITTSAATKAILEDIELLEPYGNGNRSPVFCIRDLFVLKAEIMAQKHIRAELAPQKASYGYKSLSVVSFNSAHTAIGKMLMSRYPHSVTIYGTLKKNIWNGYENIQFILSDISLS